MSGTDLLAWAAERYDCPVNDGINGKSVLTLADSFGEVTLRSHGKGVTFTVPVPEVADVPRSAHTSGALEALFSAREVLNSGGLLGGTVLTHLGRATFRVASEPCRGRGAGPDYVLLTLHLARPVTLHRRTYEWLKGYASDGPLPSGISALAQLQDGDLLMSGTACKVLDALTKRLHPLLTTPQAIQNACGSLASVRRTEAETRVLNARLTCEASSLEVARLKRALALATGETHA